MMNKILLYVLSYNEAFFKEINIQVRTMSIEPIMVEVIKIVKIYSLFYNIFLLLKTHN